MSYEFIMYPTQVKEIAFEINRACDNYKARKISNDQLREVVLYYATNFPEKLFYYQDLNPTVKKIIGTRRIVIVNVMLDGFQTSMIKGGGLSGK